MKKVKKKTKRVLICSNCDHEINMHSRYGCMAKVNNQWKYCPCGEPGPLYEKPKRYRK